MVATYDRNGIRFLYPDNWQVQEDNPQPQAVCVTVQSPGSGFWMLQIFPSGPPLEQLASEAVQSVQQDYEDVEVAVAREDVEGTLLAGFDLQFFCFDFLVSARVRGFSLQDRLCLLLTQAEDSEFEQIAPVFSAITTSLIKEANQSTATRD